MLSTMRMATGCTKHWMTPGQTRICKFIGFCCGSIGVSVILSRDAASLDDWCPTFRNITVASSSRIEMEMTLTRCFETSCTSHTRMQRHKTRRAHTSDTDFLLRHDVHTDFIKPPSYKYQQLSLSGGKTAEEWSWLYPTAEAYRTLNLNSTVWGDFIALCLCKRKICLNSYPWDRMDDFLFDKSPKKENHWCQISWKTSISNGPFPGISRYFENLKTAMPLEMCRTIWRSYLLFLIPKINDDLHRIFFFFGGGGVFWAFSPLLKPMWIQVQYGGCITVLGDSFHADLHVWGFCKVTLRSLHSTAISWRDMSLKGFRRRCLRHFYMINGK